MRISPYDGDLLTIDGSLGEGGGQILRSSLALAICLRRPFRIVNIRARRPKPGLRPQHLAAVRAAAAVCDARVDGAAIGAQALTFEPGEVHAGAHEFRIGTAGSTSLVLQTVLPALLTASRSSDLRLEGGTHNPRAPTFECLAKAYLPLIARMGPRISIELERAGFEPAGGGVIHARVEPSGRLEPIELESRGSLRRVAAEVLLSRLPTHIGVREATVLANELGIDIETVRVRTLDDSPGPGNVVTVFVESERVTDVFAEFGRRGVPAERVAHGAALAAKQYLATDAPVGVHLADQLLLPLALAGGGSFVTLPPSTHTRTNIDVIQAFLAVDIRCVAIDETGRWRIEVTRRAT